MAQVPVYPLDTDLAWLAGIIDGEGNISLNRSPSKRSYCPQIQITNMNAALLDKAEAIMCGLGAAPSRGTFRKNTSYSGAIQYGRLSLHGNTGVIPVLRAVVPYMTAPKRDFADVLISLHALRSGRRNQWTEDEMAQARAVREQFMPRAVREAPMPIRPRKKRRNSARGEQIATSRLTERDVHEIRRRYEAGGISMQKLADEKGVSASSIHRIVHRLCWVHVVEENSETSPPLPLQR